MEHGSNDKDVSEIQYPANFATEGSFRNKQSTPLIFLFGVIFVLLLIGVSITTLLVTTPGQKLLNSMFPTPERTLSIMDTYQALPEAYALKIDNSDNFFEGIYHNSSEVRGTFAFDVDSVVPSSTFSMKDNYREFIVNKENILISDIFGDSYVDIHSAYLGLDTVDLFNQIKTILSIDVDKLLTQSSDRYTIDSDVNNFFIKIDETYNPWIVVDKDTYQLQSVLLSIGNLNVSLSPEYDDVIFTDISVGMFGDLLARESVVLRTNDEGRFDQLWHDWETFYFDCYKCAYRLGDEDKDGIRNMSEFVLGTDPLVSDSVDTTYIDQNYATFFIDTLYSTATPSARSGYLVFEVEVPETATALTFEYSQPEIEGGDGYLGVYVNDELQALLPPTQADSDPVKVGVPLPVYLQGESIELSFVMNSVGISGQTMRFENVEFISAGEEGGLSKLLHKAGYKQFPYRENHIETIPLILSDNDWEKGEFSELEAVNPKQSSVLYEQQVVPTITLSVDDSSSVGVIKRRIDESETVLPNICVLVPKDKQSGHIEFQYLEDGSREYELVTVYNLSTLHSAGLTSTDTEGFYEANVQFGERGPGTLVIGVFNNGSGQAEATFSNLEYYTTKKWNEALNTHGLVDSICADLQKNTEY